jgi:hypothetical protein
MSIWETASLRRKIDLPQEPKFFVVMVAEHSSLGILANGLCRFSVLLHLMSSLDYGAIFFIIVTLGV